MESPINLEVKTVPAFDAFAMRPHTAFTVFRKCEGSIMLASAWTLKDALSLFACLYGCEQQKLRLLRPFRPQRSSSESFL